MIREQIDEYLDGGLSAGERAAMEGRLAREAGVREAMTAARADRAVRAAAWATYAPTASESGALAARTLRACWEEAAAPVGRIGVWVKRSLGVAAGLALLVAAFAAGRVTSPVPAAPAAVAQTEVVRVLYADDGGEPQMKEFANLDEANAFCRDVATKHAEPVVVASGSNGFDEEHPGSF